MLTMATTETQLSPLAKDMLSALGILSRNCVPHACGGFTREDIMSPLPYFKDDSEVYEALEELDRAGLIEDAGEADEPIVDDNYSCHRLTERGRAAVS